MQYFTNKKTGRARGHRPYTVRVSRSVKTTLNSSCLLLSRSRSRRLFSSSFLRRSRRLFSSSFLRRSLLSCSLRLRRRSLSRLLRLAARFTASRSSFVANNSSALCKVKFSTDSSFDKIMNFGEDRQREDASLP